MLMHSPKVSIDMLEDVAPSMSPELEQSMRNNPYFEPLIDVNAHSDASDSDGRTAPHSKSKKSPSSKSKGHRDRSRSPGHHPRSQSISSPQSMITRTQLMQSKLSSTLSVDQHMEISVPQHVPRRPFMIESVTKNMASSNGSNSKTTKALKPRSTAKSGKSRGRMHRDISPSRSTRSGLSECPLCGMVP